MIQKFVPLDLRTGRCADETCQRTDIRNYKWQGHLYDFCPWHAPSDAVREWDTHLYRAPTAIVEPAKKAEALEGSRYPLRAVLLFWSFFAVLGA